MIHTTMHARTFSCSLFNSSAINLHTKAHVYTVCDENTAFLAEVRTAGNPTKPGLIWLNNIYTGMIYTSRSKRILPFTPQKLRQLSDGVLDSDIKVWAWGEETGHDDVWEMLRESPTAQDTPFQHPAPKRTKQIRKYWNISCSWFHLL